MRSGPWAQREGRARPGPAEDYGLDDGRDDEAFGDLNRVRSCQLLKQIEENDDKVRSVYGGSVGET